MPPKKFRQIHPTLGSLPAENIDRLRVEPDPLKLGIERPEGVRTPAAAESDLRGVALDVLGHEFCLFEICAKVDRVIARCMTWAAVEMERNALELRGRIGK